MPTSTIRLPGMESTARGYRSPPGAHHRLAGVDSGRTPANQGLVVQRRLWRWFRFHSANPPWIRENAVRFHNRDLGFLRGTVHSEQHLPEQVTPRRLDALKSVVPPAMRPAAAYREES